MMYELPSLIKSHLSPIDPIIIDYTISVHQGFSTSRYVYDVEVEVEDLIKAKMQNVINAGISKEISVLEDQVAFVFTCSSNSISQKGDADNATIERHFDARSEKRFLSWLFKRPRHLHPALELLSGARFGYCYGYGLADG